MLDLGIDELQKKIIHDPNRTTFIINKFDGIVIKL